jgi:hypothetical protein
MSVSRPVPRARAALVLLLLTLSVAPGCGVGGPDGSEDLRGTVTVTNFTADYMDKITLQYQGGRIDAFGIGTLGTATFTSIPYGSVTATGYRSIPGTGDSPVAAASGTLDSPTLGLSFE